ncbi:hypothetical protein GIB67_024022 [Kingdonia uniflora]|uniref:PB1 domain-containing protein n=1 Tax=Kingdonia uniflora TaxID=39325 RepID=A0A7J7NJT0_9MAGN|nr:hypothetical protein GIB67_024022 [Kingdonia uniflora]
MGNEEERIPDELGEEVLSGIRLSSNVSVQTGEEFLLEFIQDRACSRRVSNVSDRDNQLGQSKKGRFSFSLNLQVGYEDLTGILGLRRMDSKVSYEYASDFAPRKGYPVEIDKSAYSDRISRYHKEIHFGGKDSGDSFNVMNFYRPNPHIPAAPTPLPHFAWESLHGFPPYSSGVSDKPGTKMKCLCSFGGKILPRPSNGKLRYVDGETRIINIRRSLAWLDLVKKTSEIFNQPHTIKYQLLGEDLDALISVSFDEDLQNMMEYYGLERVDAQRLRIFLASVTFQPHFPSNEVKTIGMLPIFRRGFYWDLNLVFRSSDSNSGINFKAVLRSLLQMFETIPFVGDNKAGLIGILAEDAVAAEDENAGVSSVKERKSSNFNPSLPLYSDLPVKTDALLSEVRMVTGNDDYCSSSTDAFQKLKPSSKMVVSSSEESSSSCRTIDDVEASGTIVVDMPVVHSGRMRDVPSLDQCKRNMGIGDDIDISYYNGIEPNPKGVVDTSNLFDVVSRERNELNKVLGELGICRDKRLNSIVGKVETEVVDDAINVVAPLKKQKQESGKESRASSKGVNLNAVEKEALELAKRDPIRLDNQIQSSISQVAAAEHAEHDAEKASLIEQLKEKTLLCEKLQKEKAVWSEQLEHEKTLQKKQFEKESAALKEELKAYDDVKLSFAGKYSEIIFPDEDAYPVAGRPSEQTPAPPVADDTTKEEVVRLKGKVSEMEKALSRARDSINRTHQVYNKLEYERCLHKSNFDNTFKELFEPQCRYGKIKIERDEVLRK